MQRPNPDLFYTQLTFRADSRELATLRRRNDWTLQTPGVGLALAGWMIEGDPGLDIWAMDVARFGDWATMAYTNAKVRENYSRRFRIRFPNEELAAARHNGRLGASLPASARSGRQLRCASKADCRHQR